MILSPLGFKYATLLPPLRHLSVNYTTPTCPLRVPAVRDKSGVKCGIKSNLTNEAKAQMADQDMNYIRVVRVVQYFFFTT